MKIVFWGTSEIGIPILEQLNQEQEIVLVVSSPDAKIGRKQALAPSPLSAKGEELGLSVQKPKTVKDNLELKQALQETNADLFVIVSYGKILPEEIINIPKFKTLNVHFSLLPKYRGAAPVQYALLNGEKVTGTTIFILDKKMDTGQVIAQESLEIDPDDTNSTLQLKLARLSADLLTQTLPKYYAGQIKPIKQDHDQASYTKLISKTDGQIDWKNSAQEIYNQFRAFELWPGIYTTWNNKTLKIIECKISSEPKFTQQTGTTNQNLVQCADQTVLELITVQLEGKKPTDIKSFLNGYKDFSESQLG